MKGIVCIAAVCACMFLACNRQTTEDKRSVVNLNGDWQIAKTDSGLPASFAATIPVPSLVDLAQPALDIIDLPDADAEDGTDRPRTNSCQRRFRKPRF